MAAEQTRETVKERLSLLKIPLDIVHGDELADAINKLLIEPQKNPGNDIQEGKNIVLLSLKDLLKARSNREYRSYIFNASMVIPISKSLVGGAQFLNGKAPIRYMPFHFIIDLLSILEARECTVYLLGSKEHILRKMESNIRQTFPGLRIVGRCDSSFRKQNEATIVEAIRKTAPQLLLVGKGIPGGESWIARHHNQLNKGLRLWCSDIFEVFAEKKSRPPEWVFNAGLEFLFYGIRKPYKFLRIFNYLRYKFLLLFYRILKRK